MKKFGEGRGGEGYLLEWVLTVCCQWIAKPILTCQVSVKQTLYSMFAHANHRVRLEHIFCLSFVWVPIWANNLYAHFLLTKPIKLHNLTIFHLKIDSLHASYCLKHKPHHMCNSQFPFSSHKKKWSRNNSSPLCISRP